MKRPSLLATVLEDLTVEEALVLGEREQDGPALAHVAGWVGLIAAERVTLDLHADVDDVSRLLLELAAAAAEQAEQEETLGSLARHVTRAASDARAVQ